jgi:hypothetical protein
VSFLILVVLIVPLWTSFCMFYDGREFRSMGVVAAFCENLSSDDDDAMVSGMSVCIYQLSERHILCLVPTLLQYLASFFLFLKEETNFVTKKKGAQAFCVTNLQQWLSENSFFSHSHSIGRKFGNSLTCILTKCHHSRSRKLATVFTVS